ncbi:MAG TPA: hypothetical protein VGV07_03815 [Devosia sp.]|uniref:hypothetical protein n=1 Tax=Devosia sp. TaxID=1871048 RepID=UPI002DDCCD24|nr:hypothetical protein [Devosia sp.]HEV2514350.1 hypothetical protein [Devosia sp.]
MVLDYPEDHPVQRLHRRIVADPAAPALDFELEIQVRQACRLPIGLHPTFRLQPGDDLHLEPGSYDHVRTFPGTVEAGASLFLPDERFDRLDRAPTRSGGTLDATRLPLDQDVEDLLQLVGTGGHVGLHFGREGYVARLSWQPEHFPSLLFWFSNRGRAAFPWNGKHLALGVEPICSAFDLGPAISTASNPIAESGFPTAIELDPSSPFITRYRLEVSSRTT